MFQRRYFVLAPSFHGATLLAKLVNAHPKAVYLGDTYFSNRYDQICGCGSRVSECEFWQTIKRRLEVDSVANTPYLLPLTPKAFGVLADRILFRIFPMNIVFPIMNLAWDVRRDGNHAFLSGFTRFVEAVYDATASGKPEVYVDGVKSLSRLRALLAAGEPVDGVIHLVRNPLDYASSATKHRKRSHFSFAKEAYLWRRQHRDIERLSNHVAYCRIRYEDLCASPDETLAHIFEFLGLSAMTLDELQCFDKQSWHFLGNSSLFKFDWTVEQRSHDIGNFDRHLIECIATWGWGQARFIPI